MLLPQPTAVSSLVVPVMTMFEALVRTRLPPSIDAPTPERADTALMAVTNCCARVAPVPVAMAPMSTPLITTPPALMAVLVASVETATDASMRV